MNQGWIKLHRKILENPITSKADWAWLWIVMLLLANHQDSEIIWNGEKRIIKRGSFITSRSKLALHSGLHESSVERALKYLKSEQQIEQQTNKKFRLITILKYSDYQTSEQESEHQTNNKRTTNEQQLNTNKNEKNVKNVKNDNNIYNADETSATIKRILETFKKENGLVRILESPKKKKVIAARLKEFSVEQIETAIKNRACDPFMCGDNDSGEEYRKDFGSLFRNGEQIEKWLNRGRKTNAVAKKIDTSKMTSDEKVKYFREKFTI